MPSVKKQIAKKKQEASQSAKPTLEEQCVNVLRTTLPRLCKQAGVQSFHAISLTDPIFSSLGVVSKDKDSYFDSTEASRGCAETFFSQTLKTCQHLDLIRKNSVENGINKTPPCLAFMTATIRTEILDEPRKVCFVFLSGWEGNEDREKLKKRFKSSIKKAQNNMINDHKFEFFEVSTKHFSDVANVLNKDKRLSSISRPLVKPCAEKRLVTAVMNFVDKYGSNFQVTGVSTYGLHPFTEENQDDQVHRVKYSSDAVSSVKREIEGQLYFIPEIKACQECQINKPAALLMMKHVQDEESQGSTAISELLEVPPLIPQVKISKSTNDFISDAGFKSIKSIRETKTDITLSSDLSTASSSIDSRSRASSFLSDASSTVVFRNDVGDGLEEQQLFELEQDAKKSQKKYEDLEFNLGLFFKENYSRRPPKNKANEKKHEKDKTMLRV